MKSISQLGRLVFLGGMISLSSCVSTQYGPDNFKGGYSEIQIAEDRYELAVYGNSYTAKQTIRDYFLYRAAELTLKKGGTHFLLFGDKSAKQPMTVAGMILVKGSLMTYGISGTKFGNTGVIKILQAEPKDEKIYYDAQLVASQLESRIRKNNAGKRDGLSNS